MMQRSESAYRPDTEYRIVCSGVGEMHQYHAYPKPSRERAERAALQLADDLLYQATVPAHRDCLPWHIEERIIGPWIPKDGTGPPD